MRFLAILNKLLFEFVYFIAFWTIFFDMNSIVICGVRNRKLNEMRLRVAATLKTGWLS